MDAAREQLAEALRGTQGLDEADHARLVEETLQRCARRPVEPAGAPGAVRHLARAGGRAWAIADDDLVLAKTLAVAVAGMATGEALASLFGALLVLGRQLRAKRVALDPLQYRLLAALAGGPLDAGALAERISTEAERWTEADVRAALGELANAPRADGTRVALVTEEGGRFRRAGV